MQLQSGYSYNQSFHLRLFMVSMACLLAGITGFAQQATITLNADSLGKKSNGISLQNYTWKWQAGDDPQWKDPAMPDSGWTTTSTINFGEGKALPGWNGFGWFRIWIRVDSSIHTNLLGLRINQDGASEIYWDGALVGGFGKVGSSKQQMVGQRAPYKVTPLVLSDTLPHLLAIRYSNYNNYFPDFIGFQAWISDFGTINATQRRIGQQNDYLLLSLGALLTLALLHLFLFAFYPKQKLNLYYSLFVIASATALYAKYLYGGALVPAVHAFANTLFLCGTVFITVTGGILLYAVGYQQLPKRRIAIVSCIAAYFVVMYVFFAQDCNCISITSTGTNWFLSNMFFLAVMLDGIFSLAKAIRQRKPGIWLIAIGMLITALGSYIVGSDAFGWLGGNYQLIMSMMSIVIRVMPVFFSIYLALDFARMNRRLEAQLQENTSLAALNLAQEQEKNKLVSEQAERLEQTVLERTAQVRQQADQLREMDAVKSRFFVNLTHEFRTPLALILGPAEQILNKTNEQAIQFQAGLIRDNATRLLTLINQLLDLSKLEAGKMDIRHEPVDIVKLIKKTLHDYDSLTQPKQLSVAFETSQLSLWTASDSDKLEMILHNLLSNAIKFSRPGGWVKVKLAVLEEAAPFMELQVNDNGIGIPANKLPYIFDRFYQVDASDTRRQEGTGIGLALTKELAELMGGVVAITSEHGVGTCLTVRLPLRPLREPVKATVDTVATITKQPSLPLLPEENNAVTEMPLLLLIEDNDELRHFIRSILQDNYRIIEATHGREGVKLAREQIPDLVITDLMMPEMDGYEVSLQLKQHAPTSHIPIILLTARADTASKIEGWQAGADGYIAKPFHQQELLALIANLLHTRQQLAEKYKQQISVSGNTSLPSMEQVFLDRVKQVIEEYLDDEQLSVDFLGDKIGLSRTQLHRKLKGLIDQTPGELIRVIRLQRAMDLLKQNAGTVSEIAYKVGFGNPANFSTSFSRHFGYAPSEVRQQ